MSGTSCLLLAEPDDQGAFRLMSPRVGIWSAQLAHGMSVGPGSTAGTLTQLRRRFALIVPDGVAGRVVLSGPRDHVVPVAYGETLFRVIVVTVDAASHEGAGPTATHDPARGHLVTAPTDGVFYRCPTAGAKPYVEVGDRVTAGQTVGLIEVMKTFNPIAYGGVGLPDPAEVLEVLAADGQEVRAGSPLIAVR